MKSPVTQQQEKEIINTPGSIVFLSNFSQHKISFKINVGLVISIVIFSIQIGLILLLSDTLYISIIAFYACILVIILGILFWRNKSHSRDLLVMNQEGIYARFAESETIAKQYPSSSFYCTWNEIAQMRVRTSTHEIRIRVNKDPRTYKISYNHLYLGKHAGSADKYLADTICKFRDWEYSNEQQTDPPNNYYYDLVFFSKRNAIVTDKDWDSL